MFQAVFGYLALQDPRLAAAGQFLQKCLKETVIELPEEPSSKQAYNKALADAAKKQLEAKKYLNLKYSLAQQLKDAENNLNSIQQKVQENEEAFKEATKAHNEAQKKASQILAEASGSATGS